MTLPEFFEIVERFLKNRKEAVPATEETAFVDEFIAAGNSRLKEVKAWEPKHQVLRREHGTEVSATKEDKTQEIITLLSRNSDMSLEEIDKHLQAYGMRLGIIDKIHVLMSQRDLLAIRVDYLLSKHKQ